VVAGRAAVAPMSDGDNEIASSNCKRRGATLAGHLRKKLHLILENFISNKVLCLTALYYKSDKELQLQDREQQRRRVAIGGGDEVRQPGGQCDTVTEELPRCQAVVLSTVMATTELGLSDCWRQRHRHRQTSKLQGGPAVRRGRAARRQWRCLTHGQQAGEVRGTVLDDRREKEGGG
jgi:hypothetical protein